MIVDEAVAERDLVSSLPRRRSARDRRRRGRGAGSREQPSRVVGRSVIVDDAVGERDPVSSLPASSVGPRPSTRRSTSGSPVSSGPPVGQGGGFVDEEVAERGAREQRLAGRPGAAFVDEAVGFVIP
ncbi:MAG: hypothetical protein KF878_24240 [Planctomycetes bacterium]|nr:hypothetical protein [Planctomycetota bacterium]